MADTEHRSENVALDAFSCATVSVLSEGGPAKWLKNKNLQNHLCDYEPGGREVMCQVLQILARAQ